MNMLMIESRSSLKEQVHELLRTCNVFAYTEIPETIGTGETGPAEGASFHPGVNSVILVALDPTSSDRVASAVKAWCTAPRITQEGSNRPFVFSHGLARSLLDREGVTRSAKDV
jgi:hypothetical protein